MPLEKNEGSTEILTDENTNPLPGNLLGFKVTYRSIILFLLWLQLLLPAQEGIAAYQLSGSRKPADIPQRWKGLIGEYVAGMDTLSLCELNRTLEFLTRSHAQLGLREEGENEFRISPPWHGTVSRLAVRRNAQGFAVGFFAPGIEFRRLFFGGEGGGVFRIKPLKTAATLRREALQARPPLEKGRFLRSDLVELTRLDTTIHLDIRYASANNFMGEQFYSAARAFLQRPAAEALVRAHRALKKLGYGVLIHDGYRPWYVTKMFWDATPNDLKTFVADPEKGSRHNRGCAVDLSLYDLRTGQPVEMVSGYDEFSDRAYPNYPGGTSLQRWHRKLLREAMEAEGFRVFDAEWWHFDYGDWKKYPIGNVTFEQIR